MATTGQLSTQAYGLTAEERQLKSERNRVQGMINKYYRNPKNYNPKMIADLERMAMQYGLMFKKVLPDATAWQNVKGFVGGMADAAAFDFIPDNWYDSGGIARAAKNWGKGIGTVGSIALTGGAALAGRAGIMGTKALTKAASYTAPGRLAKIAGDTYRTQKAAYKGVAKIDDVVDAAKKSPGNLQEVLKGKNLSSEDINKITKKITAEYKSTPKYAEKLNKLITSKGAAPSTIEPSKIRSVVDKLSGKTETKIFTAPKKGQPKEFTKELKDILTAEKLTPAQIRELAKNLKGKNAPKTFDEIADWLVNSQKSSPTIGGFGAIDPTKALIGGAAALGAGQQLATWRTPSREEKMAEEYDIYN